MSNLIRPNEDVPSVPDILWNNQKAGRTRPSKGSPYPYITDSLSRIISHEFRHSSLALALFNELLSSKSYSRSFALKLIEAAKSSRVESWEVRRLAALMLENQVLKLAADNTDEFDFLFLQLGLKPALGECELTDRVLKEGYSTTQLRRFILEFRRKLARLNRVHEKLAGARTSQRALRDFINLSKCDCKISIARYLFTPEEVVERIIQQTKTSRGVPDFDHTEPSSVNDEVARTFDLLPLYEAKILRGLCKAPTTYWVSDSTDSEINSLVEYPLTTVVLVIKPPGSDLEFEIKRAGRRLDNPLNAVFWRNGYTVPHQHRLDGGSMLTFLRHESNSAARFSAIYRQAHANDAPISRIVSRASIFAIPRKSGREENILEYFSNPNLFGDGFLEMREALKESVEAFNEYDKSSRIDIPGDLGLTMQFLHHCTPGQAILSGSSSFRLDKVNAYLSERGAEVYFKHGLRRSYSWQEARRFADAILEEILGVYSPPADTYRSHKQYVAAAFSVAENRERADRIYLNSIRQIGTFWGTLLAVRGYSWGESFVPRNVGLKSFWSDGQWKVKMIFMDHDCLNMVEKSDRDFDAQHNFNGIATDARYIGGEVIFTRREQTEMYFLEEIYRPEENLCEEGKALLYRSVRRAYRDTHDAVLNDPRMRSLFSKVFVERLHDWDMIVKSYIKTKPEGPELESWKESMKALLKEKNYPQWVIETHLRTVENYAGFLENLHLHY
jgi:hypothetical protein